MNEPYCKIETQDETHIDSDIVFSVKGKEQLRLTEKGFVYKGKVIEDAGKAHKLFTQLMNAMIKPGA